MLAPNFHWPDNTSTTTFFDDMPFCQSPTDIYRRRRYFKWLLSGSLICITLGAGTTIFAAEPQAGIAPTIDAEIKVPVFTLLLPTWTTAPQKVQLVQPKEDDLSRFELESHEQAHSTSHNQPSEKFPAEKVDLSIPKAEPPLEAPVNTESDTVPAITHDTDSPTTAHLLIPQLAPPTFEAVEFPEWTPASDIWIKGFAAIIQGERQQEADDLVAAIASFQSARGAYEMVESRFPEWQSDIVSFRLGDLERRIRLLVQKTATAESK